METRSATDIATDWIQKWSAPSPPSIGAGVSDSTLDWEIPRENPQLCLECILEILDRIPSDPANNHFQVLAAGPLEDLLNEHGEAVVDDIEVLARRDPRFRLLLNGVWPSGVSESVMNRLAKYRKEPW